MRSLMIGVALVTATPASAEVVSSSANGFIVRHSIQTVVPAPAAMAAFQRVGDWWEDEHTYSGSAANLTLDARPGGCFCERFPGGGGIEHLRVTYAKPGERVILTGALGPLLYEAVSGSFEVKAERIAGGSRLTLEYRASGFARGNAAELAPLVDQMLGTQMRRLRTAIGSGPRRTDPIR